MATYTDPSTINTNPNDPVTSEFGTAALDNPIAIAEGASGAPRVQPEALGTYLGAGTSTVSITGLTDVGWVLVGYTFALTAPSGESATGKLFYATSTDNGSTYGATTELLEETTGTTTARQYSGTFLLQLSGSEDAIQFTESRSVTGGGGGGALGAEWSVLGVGRK